MKHLGLLSFLMVVIGLTFTVTRWRGGLHMTFSQHAAQTKASRIYYPIFFIITLPVLYAFMAYWLAPEFSLGTWFVVIAGTSMLAQIICAFFPEVGGWKSKTHRILTAISGILLLPLIFMVGLSPQLAGFIKVTAWASFVGMIWLLGVAAIHRDGYKYALLLQTGYYGLFFMVILAATYAS